LQSAIVAVNQAGTAVVVPLVVVVAEVAELPLLLDPHAADATTESTATPPKIAFIPASLVVARPAHAPDAYAGSRAPGQSTLPRGPRHGRAGARNADVPARSRC
jgi:hypothetical protein